MKQNRVVTWILAVIVLGIWGTIVYQISAAVSEENGNEEVTGLSTPVESPKSLQNYAYKADVRDPFHYQPVGEKPRPKPNSTQPPLWIPPPLRLTGILTRETSATAVVEGNDGRVYFLQVGDTLLGLRIIRISGQAVQYFYRNKKAEWILEGKQ